MNADECLECKTGYDESPDNCQSAKGVVCEDFGLSIVCRHCGLTCRMASFKFRSNLNWGEFFEALHGLLA
jgi:hypothetical protein